MRTSPSTRPTRTVALFVLSRSGPRLWPTRSLPETVRASIDSTSSARTSALLVVTLTAPSGPASSTSPDPLPTTTSVPAGTRTTSAVGAAPELGLVLTRRAGGAVDLDVVPGLTHDATRGRSATVIRTRSAIGP